jgi:hypothetical protein
MSSRALRSRSKDLEEDHTQFSGSEVDNSYREQEHFECPSTENLSVVHEHDGSEIHSPKVDRIQTPADRHREKETSCEGDFNTGTIASFRMLSRVLKKPTKNYRGIQSAVSKTK